MSYKLKILVGGSAATGKTSLIHRFVKGTYKVGYKLTVGVDILSKNLDMGDGNIPSLSIWDIGGQTSFSFLRTAFYKGASGVLLFFDLSRAATYDNVLKWFDDIRSYEKDVPVIIIAAKDDLIPEIGNVIDFEAVQEELKKLGITCIKTSAKNGKNVKKAFVELCKLILNAQGEKIQKKENLFTDWKKTQKIHLLEELLLDKLDFSPSYDNFTNPLMNLKKILKEETVNTKIWDEILEKLSDICTNDKIPENNFDFNFLKFFINNYSEINQLDMKFDGIWEKIITLSIKYMMNNKILNQNGFLLVKSFAILQKINILIAFDYLILGILILTVFDFEFLINLISTDDSLMKIDFSEHSSRMNEILSYYNIIVSILDSRDPNVFDLNSIDYVKKFIDSLPTKNNFENDLSKEFNSLFMQLLEKREKIAFYSDHLFPNEPFSNEIVVQRLSFINFSEKNQEILISGNSSGTQFTQFSKKIQLEERSTKSLNILLGKCSSGQIVQLYDIYDKQGILLFQKKISNFIPDQNQKIQINNVVIADEKIKEGDTIPISISINSKLEQDIECILKIRKETFRVYEYSENVIIKKNDLTNLNINLAPIEKVGKTRYEISLFNNEKNNLIHQKWNSIEIKRSFSKFVKNLSKKAFEIAANRV